MSVGETVQLPIISGDKQAGIQTYSAPAGSSPLNRSAASSVVPRLSEVFWLGRQPDDVEFPLMAAENMLP